MNETADPQIENRVLVLAPTARDSVICRDLLKENQIPCFIFSSIGEICAAAEQGAGLAIVTAESLVSDKELCLTHFLHHQPSWSDFPLIVLTPPGPDSPALLRALESVGHTTLMKRPVQLSTLLSAVKTALRDRQRQYSVRSYLIEQKQTAQTLREADQRKDDFIALLAHELRNPLAPIRNGLQVMRLAGEHTQGIAQTRAMMDRQLSHMVRLIDDLLDISRINRSKMELRLSRVLLTDIISNAVETARPLIEAEQHELSISLPLEPVFLEADLTRLAQVFSNILANSAKYTPRHGQIWLKADVCQNKVKVTVRDNGIGIPAKSLPTIFEMFSQVNRSIERTTGGLGIGLALVKGLVEMHRGTVEAVSNEGNPGTTFIVQLPIMAVNHSVDKECSKESLAKNDPKKRRILAVDDNHDAASSLALMLELLGNDVTTAHDGLEAIKVAERFQPDLILMDVGMPRLNGLDATRRIREQTWGKEIPVIALTGWGQESDKLRSQEAGCNGHLVKPVSLADLQTLLTKQEA